MTKKKEKKALPDRASLKSALKEIKVKRQEAVEAKDAVQLKRIRSQYKKTNRVLRRVAAAEAATAAASASSAKAAAAK
jgi:hypothetical protein